MADESPVAPDKRASRFEEQRLRGKGGEYRGRRELHKVKENALEEAKQLLGFVKAVNKTSTSLLRDREK